VSFKIKDQKDEENAKKNEIIIHPDKISKDFIF